MFYEYDLTIPAGTAYASAARSLVRLNKGVITRVEVMIPRGSAGLSFSVAERGDHQVWPSNPDNFVKGDDVRISWAENYRLDDEPLTFRLRGWSPNARFAHTHTWRFELLDLASADAAAVAPSLIQRLYDSLIGGRGRAR